MQRTDLLVLQLVRAVYIMQREFKPWLRSDSSHYLSPPFQKSVEVSVNFVIETVASLVASVIPRFGEIILELGRRSLSKLGHCISALLHRGANFVHGFFIFSISRSFVRTRSSWQVIKLCKDADEEKEEARETRLNLLRPYPSKCVTEKDSSKVGTGAGDFWLQKGLVITWALIFSS